MNKRALAVIIAGFLTVFTAFAIRYSYGMLLPEMLPSLDISMTQAGIIYASYFIAYTVCSPVLGFLGDRYDVRIILTVFVAILGAGAFLMSFSSSVISASLFLTIAGIGHSACWAPVVALAQRWVSDKRRGIVVAFVDLGSASGIVVWSAAIPFIVATYSWREGWMSLGAVGFIVAGMNFMLIKGKSIRPTNPQRSLPDRPAHETITRTYRRLLRDVNLWLLGLSYLLVGFTVIIPFTFLCTYATQELNMPYDTSTRLLAVIAIAGMAGKLGLGALSDFLGRPRVMMMCTALLGAGSLGMAYSKDFFILGLFAAIFGLGYGSVWPVYAAAAPDYFYHRSAGSVIGLWTLYLGLGSMLSPVISGWTIDTTGTHMWSFIMGAVSAMISLLLLVPMLKRKPLHAS